MDAEVLRDLRESGGSIAVLGDAEHVVAERLGKRLGHDDIFYSPASSAGRARCHLFLRQTQMLTTTMGSQPGR